MLLAGSIYSKGKEVKGDTNIKELVETVSCLKKMVETIWELLYLEVLNLSYLQKY